MKLKKFHGLGNEFLLTSIRSLPKDSSRIARFLCDYTNGPGADGLILVCLQKKRISIPKWLYSIQMGHQRKSRVTGFDALPTMFTWVKKKIKLFELAPMPETEKQ